MEFDYYLSQKGVYVAAALAGHISEHDMPKLEELIAEVEQSKANYYAFCFRRVESVHVNVIPLLIKLQHSVRVKQASLRVCTLNKKLQAVLNEAGAIRESELSPNMAAAFKDFIAEKRIVKNINKYMDKEKQKRALEDHETESDKKKKGA